MITIKSAKEILTMKEAGRLLCECMNLVENAIKPGVSTISIDKIAEAFIMRNSALPSFKNYNGFPATVCISVNEQVVHGIPSSYKLREGDIVGIDMGLIYKGFHSDMARTFPVGEISADAQKIIDTAKLCFDEAVKVISSGTRVSEIGRVIETVAVANGFFAVKELCGHGIGRDLHESPEVPNCIVRSRGSRMQKGMTLAIEPMINAGGWKIKFAKDGQTIVTNDGRLSAHYENSLVVTDDGYEILTTL